MPQVFATCLVGSALAVTAHGKEYFLSKGDKSVCEPFLTRQKEIQYVKPTFRKDSARWDSYREKCPNFLTKERWMRDRNSDFEDYALYRVDIDNDGKTDEVLYRRYDKDHYTTYLINGRESRKLEGVDISEEFYVVDVASCKMEKVLAEYARNSLIKLDGQTYIQNLNHRDRGKALAIYKKQKGVELQGSYQDEICLFRQQ